MIDLSSPKRNTTLNHTKKLGNVEFSGYIKSQPETIQIMFSIEKYLQNHHPFYLNSLLSELKGKQINVIKQRLQEQYKGLVNGKSFYHMINNAIQARRKCINKIRRDITKSGKFLAFFPKQYPGVTEQDVAYQDWVELQGYSAVDIDESIQQSIRVISNIFVDMSRLRDMTIYLVEQVHGWRMNIEQHSDRCQQHTQVKYFFEGESLYERLLKDTQFIWVSKLSQYIWMQCKQDPFMIRNVIVVDQKEEKTALQKYFLEILYPKDDVLIDKTVQCFEMLAYKFKPKLYNRFQEQELLIENYLRIEMNEHQFDEREGAIEKVKLAENKSQKIEKEVGSIKGSDESPKKQKNRLSVRGWVFEKQLKKSTRDRINEIVETHKNKMGMIKPFAIANYAQKNSIALAYLSEVKKENKRQPRIKINSVQSQDESKKCFSEGEDKAVPKKIIEKSHNRQIESEPEPYRGKSRMFSSLTKLSPVILQDPKQNLPDTPKANSKQKPTVSDQKMTTFISMGKQPSMQGIKFNSFGMGQEQSHQTKIEVEGEQTPLNLSQFYQIFRADTNKPKKPKDSRVTNKTKESNVKKEAQLKPIQTEKEKLISFKQLLDRSRKQRAERYRSMTHLPYVRKPLSISVRKRQVNKSKEKEKAVDKSNESFNGYSKIKIESPVINSQEVSQTKKLFLTLQTKSLPLDLVPTYVKHLESKRPAKSRIFTDFTLQNLITRLSDPFVHSIIFDIVTEKQQLVGTMILSEGFGGRAGKLKYTMEYMSIQPFEMISVAMLRVAEQLLSATPCLEVVYPLLLDKLDVVSCQFIDLIDGELSVGVQKFGQFLILQKPRHSLSGTDVRQRVYVFTSPLNMKKQYDLGLKMMGNYRSLKFDCKCIVLSSNFRLRSETLIKNTLHRYSKISIGELFARTLTRIMTKYHLKQLRQASFGGQGELGELVRGDPFLRSVMQAAARGLQDYTEQLITTTVFGSMEELLNYLRYKNLDYHFQVQFLSESRFILQHELVLVEIDQQLSLQFTLTSNQQLYILHNYKRHQIIQINSSKLQTSAYLFPTSNEKIKLFGMSASHYLENTTDRLDLYTYLSFFFRHIHSEIFLNQVPSIVMPNLKKCNTKINKVSMYDGFFKLFPEREFYSAAMMSCSNFWQSFYADAVIHTPVQQSLVLEFPFLLGYYDCQNKVLLAAFLYTGEEGSASP